jgi:hypothetical protein
MQPPEGTRCTGAGGMCMGLLRAPTTQADTDLYTDDRILKKDNYVDRSDSDIFHELYTDDGIWKEDLYMAGYDSDDFDQEDFVPRFRV